MRSSRTEDIVRELYLAVNENDYWVHYFTGLHKISIPDFNYQLPVLYREAPRVRMDTLLRYIYTTVKKWLTPFSDAPTLPEPNVLKFVDPSYSCFLDLQSNSNPFLVERDRVKPFVAVGRWYGFDNLNYSEGGRLESETGYDLEIMRTFSSHRVDIEFLHFVYSLLNFNKKVGGSVSRSFNSVTFPSRSDMPSFTDSSSDFYGFGERIYGDSNSSVNGQNGTTNEAIDNFFNDPTYNYFNNLTSTTNEVRSRKLNNSRIVSSVQNVYGYFRYNVKGYDDTYLNMGSIDMDLRTWGFNLHTGTVSDADFMDYLPQGVYGYGENIITPQIQNINGVDVFLYGEKWDSLPRTAPTSDGDPELLEDDFQLYPILPFLDFNKEGFLKYYTEEAN